MCARSSAAGTSLPAASIVPPRRTVRQARRSSRSSSRPRSNVATRQVRCCATSTRQLRPATRCGCPSGGHEKAEYTLRGALKVSSNRAAAQLLQQIGVGAAVYYAQRLGIESQLPMVPSLALGTGEVTLLELTTAYTAFANRGSVAAPRFITRVDDAAGATIYNAAERHTQAISSDDGVSDVEHVVGCDFGGTGHAARAAGFKLPAAGKTGTTDNYADAWFVGYTPHLVAGVWFGLDRPAPIMRGGFAGVVAAPAWGRFMRVATAHDKPDWYEMPADVEKVAICRRAARARPRPANIKWRCTASHGRTVSRSSFPPTPCTIATLPQTR